MFGFLRPRNVAEMAALRDENIKLETKVLLLTDLVERQRRPTRERRKDSSAFKAAKQAMTERLRMEMGK